MSEKAPELDFRTGVREIRTLVILELEDAGTLFERFDDESASEILAAHDRLVRDLLGRSHGREIEKSERFLLLFERPLDAVRYGLAYHQAVAALGAELARPLTGRLGIHLGEVFLRRNSPEHVERGAKPLEVEGPARALAARVMAIASGGQTLLTQVAFDLAQRAAVGDESLGDDVAWLRHGSFRFGDGGPALEIFEVGAAGVAPFVLADPSEPVESRRQTPATRVAADAWRPAPGEPIPHRANWSLERPLGIAGDGEPWLGRHRKTGERRVFRFYRRDDLPRVNRQLAVGRHLRRKLGEHEVVVRAVDSQLDREPYFLETEHVAGNGLPAWAESRRGLAEVPLSTRLEIAAGLAELVAAVHSADVALGDLRPSSVLVQELPEDGPRILLADLSRARIVAAGDVPDDLSESPRDDPAPSPYRAPELDSGAPATPKTSPRTDVYALGILLYQLVTGDLNRAPGPFWHRDVGDELLRERIAGLIDPDPRRRAADASGVARALRGLETRRAEPENDRRDPPSAPGLEPDAPPRGPGLLRSLIGRRGPRGGA